MKRLQLGAVLAVFGGITWSTWTAGAKTPDRVAQEPPFAVAGGQGVSLPIADTAPAVDRALAFLDAQGSAFGLDRSRVTMARPPKRDALGFEHVRFQQVYQGIPVAGGEFLVHLKGSRAMAANGRVLDRFPDEMEPAIATATAVGVAREVIGKYRKSDADGARYSVPTLQVFNRGFLEHKADATSRLAWFVEATGPALREFIWIDARTGALLLHFSQLAGAKQREIYNANGGPALPGTLIRSEGQGPIGNADIDGAYDLAGITYDYFFNTFGRDGLNGAGGTMALTVSWNGGPNTCPMSFWNGSLAVFCLGFTAADDIVAHELTHGLIQSEANLFAYVQSGALAESYSDIFGEAVDLANVTGADTPGVRWRIGEDLSVGALRDMMDPTVFQDPGKMSDVQYFACETTDDNGGVHTNSGPPNHAFALMVDGGVYNGYEITGIGFAKATRIQYRALTTYLTMTSGFADNVDAVDQACADLTGTNGITASDCTQVHNAQLAVEMNARWSCQDPLVPILPALCPSGGAPSFVFLDGFEGASPPWTMTSTTGTFWAIQSSQAAEGARAAFGPNPGTVSDHSIGMTSSVVLPAGARAIFTHAPNLEPLFDGGVVEYSANGGATWVDAVQFADAGLLPDTICPDCGSPLANRLAWSKASFGYQRSRLNLASLAGQNVRLRFRVGTDSSIAAPGWTVDNVGIYSCVAAAGAPAIGTGPAAQTVGAGGTATFSVSASGNPTLRYQWLKDGAPIAGATSNALVITNVQLSDFGHYSVIVSNAEGTAISDGAALFVAIGGQPALTSQPSNTSVTAGQTARFAADAVNANSFQWQVSVNGGASWNPVPNAAPYTGATTRVLTITGATLGLNGNLYRLIVANGSGTALSQAASLGVLPPSFVANGTFGTGDTSGWSVFESPAGASESRINAGVFEWNRKGNSSTQATIFQNTGVTVTGGALEATFDLGNSANIRQRVSVLMIDADFSDITVCTFWLDPGAPMRPYRMRTHTTRPWTNAAIYFYAATTASFAANGGYLRLDNVVFDVNAGGSETRTDCVDPTSPVPPGGAESASLVLNGDFSQGMSFWQAFGTITGAVTDGVFQFIRTAGLPAGVVFQATGAAVAPNEFLTAKLDLGNSSAVRKRVTVLVHANDFSDLAACTFFLPPGLPLSPYAVRMRATKAWAAGPSTGATLSIYGATVGSEPWIEVDNASLTRTPGTAIQGTECFEPVEILGSSSWASSGASASATSPASNAPAALAPSTSRASASRAATPRTADLGRFGSAGGGSTSWLADAAAPVEVQVSHDGVEWVTLMRVPPGEDWSDVEVDLRAFAGEAIRVRLVYVPPAVATSGWRVISLRIVR
jgi:bacillolysin